MVADGERKKGKKKDKTSEDLPEGPPAEGGEQDQQKKKKKKKKSKKPQEEAAVEAEEAEVVADVDEGEAAEKKKKKKKKKSKVPSEPVEDAPEPMEVTAGDDATKKKKKKKSKKKEGVVEEAAAEPEEKKKSKQKKRKRDDGEGEPAAKKTKGGAPPTDVAAWREAAEITISEESYLPLFSFDDEAFPSAMRCVVAGFEKPTPIQSQTWPILFDSRDVVGIAETGSGKTLAFSLPCLELIRKRMAKQEGRNPVGPMMLVMAPTRELAIQTHKVCEAAGEHFGVISVCIYGGVPKKEQKALINKGAQIVVATPGRLLDLVNEGSCPLGRVRCLVLDEADRMLEEGFEKAIREILSNIPKKRQTAMFSATWPEEIRQLAGEFMQAPVQVNIGSADLSANTRVKQIVEVIEGDKKEARLLQLLDKYHSTGKNRVLVFGLYKKECARLETYLQRQGWPCTAIHGDKGQAEREKALSAFKDGSQPLLIATDVAARGIDIKGIEFVINYSFPLTIEDYVHRIGRTGRAGANGVAHTFFTRFDKARSGELVNILRDAGMDVPKNLMAFGTDVKKKEPKFNVKIGAGGDVSNNVNCTRIVFDSDSE